MARRDDKTDGDKGCGCGLSFLNAEADPMPPRLQALARQLQQALLAARKPH